MSEQTQPTGQAKLVRLGRDREARITETVVAAFSEDPVSKALRLSPRAISRMYGVPAALGLRNGEVYGSSDALEGVMVIHPGEDSVFGFRHVLRATSVFTVLGMAGLLLRPVMRRMFTVIETDHKALDIGPYIYLALLAVAPQHQGKGHAGRLMRFLVDRARDQGRAIYLETQTASNVRLYEHYGFEVVKHIPFTDEISIWEMVRPAG